MEVYLLRHGIAEASLSNDAARELTPEGKAKVRDVVKSARQAGVEPALIVSSPYRRAASTARIAAQVLGYSGDIGEWPCLVPEGEPKAVWDQLREQRASPSVLLAGHQPLFGDLAAYLLGMPGLRIDFKKAALVALEIPAFGYEPRGILKWMLVPRLLG